MPYATTTLPPTFSPNLDQPEPKFHLASLSKNCITSPSKNPKTVTLDSTQADESREVMMVDVDWRVKIIDIITNEKLPTDKNKAVTIARRSNGYVLVGDKLYKRGSHSGVLMKCRDVGPRIATRGG